MAKNNESLNNDLFGLLRSRGYQPTMLGTDGKEIPVPDEAEVFQFKFIKDEEDYGPVTLSVDGLHKLVVYFGDNVANSPSEETHSEDISWYSLLRHLKRFSQQHQLSFEVKNTDHLKHDMAKRTHMKKVDEGSVPKEKQKTPYRTMDQHRAAGKAAQAKIDAEQKAKDAEKIGKKVSEGYYPTGKKSSYSDNIPEVKIILQHSRALEEGERRYRAVEKIFVENASGERFAIPTNKPGLARVYARHIAEGGTPYDEQGKHIGSLCEEYAKMAGFVRAVRSKQFNEGTQSLVNEGINHYQSLRETLSKMQGHRGYHAYFESWTPTLTEDDDSTDLSEMFATNDLDPRIESVMPILRKLNKHVSEMVETDALAEWADDIIEESLAEEPVEEGVMDAVKRGVKSVKRGMQGWGNNMPGGGPKDIVKRNKSYTDSTIKDLSQYDRPAGSTEKYPEHSPRGLQQQVIDREMKKRGLDLNSEHPNSIKRAPKSQFVQTDKQLEETAYGDAQHGEQTWQGNPTPASDIPRPWTLVLNGKVLGTNKNVAVLRALQQKHGGKIVRQGEVAEAGRFIKGPGGVPLDRQGNPIEPKPPKAPARKKLTLDDVWRKVEEVVGNIFPDGDPIDWMLPWLERQGIEEYKCGDIIDRAARKNGYKDMYAYWNELKTGDYGHDFDESVEQGVVEGDPGYNKNTFVGKIRRGLDARSKANAQIKTGSADDNDDLDSVKKSLRNATRLYNLTHKKDGSHTTGGFPKSTVPEIGDVFLEAAAPWDANWKKAALASKKAQQSPSGANHRRAAELHRQGAKDPWGTYKDRHEEYAAKHEKAAKVYGESVEQVDEISQDTARSYSQKANASKKDLVNQTWKKGADTGKLNAKIKNRQAGLNRAQSDKRYYKDEQVNELSPDTKDQGVSEGLKFHNGFPDVDHMNGAVYRNGAVPDDPRFNRKECPLCHGSRWIWTNYEKGATPNNATINPNTPTLKSTRIKCPTCLGGTKRVTEESTKMHNESADRPSFADWTGDYVRDNLHKLKKDWFESYEAWLREVESTGASRSNAGDGKYKAVDSTGSTVGVWDENTGTGWTDFSSEQVDEDQSEGNPDTDQILYYLTSGYRELLKYRDQYMSFDTIENIYNYLRDDLKQGNYEEFDKTYNRVLMKYPDAATELFDAMFEAAGLGDEATIEEFMAKCNDQYEADPYAAQKNDALGMKYDTRFDTYSLDEGDGLEAINPQGIPEAADPLDRLKAILKR